MSRSTNHAPAGAFRRTKPPTRHAQPHAVRLTKLDLQVIDVRAGAKASIDGNSARRSRVAVPALLDPLPLEWLAQHEARAVEAEKLSSRR